MNHFRRNAILRALVLNGGIQPGERIVLTMARKPKQGKGNNKQNFRAMGAKKPIATKTNESPKAQKGTTNVN